MFNISEQLKSHRATLTLMKRLKYLSKTFGLHPLTAIVLLVVDWMLFGEEVATGGIGWVISLPVGVLLGLAAVLIQKRFYKDESRPAIAKGFVVALLTAIPAPLSSLGLLPLAAFGAVRVLYPDHRQLAGQPKTPATNTLREDWQTERHLEKAAV
jgi:hypothetical protein